MEDLLYGMYVLLVAVCTTGGLIFLIQTFLKPIHKYGKLGYLLLFLLSISHDSFENVMSSYSTPAIKCMEFILFYVLAGVILWYFFQGKGIINFILVYAVDFMYQAFGTICVYLTGGLVYHFDLKAFDENLDKFSVQNCMLFLISLTMALVISWFLVRILLKKINRTIHIIAAFLAGMKLLAELIASSDSLYVIVPVVVIVLVIAMIHQEKRLKQMEKQEEYYHVLEARQQIREEELARIRHDLANHIDVLDSTKSQEYAKEILRNIEDKIKSGVPILDCLLDEKRKTCVAKGIEFQENISNLSGTVITNYDWVSLIANLLDNAIEACEKAMVSKIIKMDVERKGDYLVLVVTNSKNGDDQPLQNNFHTSKKNEQQHGYGTRIIKKIAEKYDGRIQYKDMGEQLEAHIVMHGWESGEQPNENNDM